MTFAVAYQIPLPGAALQGVSTADRPLCALVSAYASWLDGKPLFGAWKTLSRSDQRVAFQQSFKALDVPLERAELWANGVRGVRPPFNDDPRVGDNFVLDPYQMEALKALSCGGGGLALGCGLGKTGAAVKAAIDSQYHSRCWVLRPVNATETWDNWRPLLEQHFKEVQFLSTDSAHNFQGAANIGGVLIIDEAHKAGLTDSRRTKAAHGLRPLFDYGLCLTGTLLNSGVVKAMSILDLCVPGGALFANHWKAGEHFNCLVRKFIGKRRVTALEKPSGARRDAFMAYVSRLIVSMNKHSEIVRQSLILPEQQIHDVKLGEPWRELDVIVGEWVRQRIAETGVLPHAQAAAHALCRAGMDAKLPWLLEFLARDEEPAVVFAQYQESLDTIEAALRAEDITVVRVDGAVTGTERKVAMRAFQAGEFRVFLGQMEAASESMDLFRAHNSVAMDHTWKAEAYNQALARTCRRGQTQECRHYNLMTNGLQARVIQRLAASEDFDASLAEYQQLRASITAAAQPQGVQS